MSRLRKLERDFACADMAGVESLLAQLGDDDVMARIGLEARLDELRQEIERLSEAEEELTASAALFFGGRPVLGTLGIEAEFATAAIGAFQDLVAKVLAQETTGLAQRGMVPNKTASTLHITNIVRGSFGFLLEEIQKQQEMIETPLKAAVDQATQLLDAFGEPDEEQFRSAIETIDHRILETAREFFDLMEQNGATLRVIAGEKERSFGVEAVKRATERAVTTTVDDSDESIYGQLAGVLPDAHQFEFRAGVERGVIRGKVDRALSAQELSSFNRDWVNTDAAARVRIRRVLRNGSVVRESYTLIGLDRPDEAPAVST